MREMRGQRILQAYYGTPLALTEDKRTEIKLFIDRLEDGGDLKEIFDFVKGHSKGNRITAQSGDGTGEDANYTVLGGVAIIPVYDVIGPKMNMLMYFSGGTSVDLLVRDIKEAASRSDVNSILFDVDSPGGDASNLANVSDLIFSLRDVKPSVALINPSGYSGAQWIASAAKEVYMASSTAGAGSIGVVIEHRDLSGMQEKRGVKTTEIYSGKYKRIASQYGQLSKEGKQYLQDRADFVYSLFVDEMARNYSVSVDQVLEDMADGRVFIGQQAVDAGLAKGIMPFHDVLDQMRQRIMFPGMEFSSRLITEQKEVVMDLKELKEKHPETYQAAFAEGKSAGMEEGKKIGAKDCEGMMPEGDCEKKKAALREEGAAAERARIQGINEIAVAGYEDVINPVMFDGKTTAADAAMLILKAQKERGSLQGIKDDATGAKHQTSLSEGEENLVLSEAKKRASKAKK